MIVQDFMVVEEYISPVNSFSGNDFLAGVLIGGFMVSFIWLIIWDLDDVKNSKI